MNINDEKVINYLENNGTLFEDGTWNEYAGMYLDTGSRITDHLASGECEGIVKNGDIKLHEKREKEFLSTFEGSEDVVMLTASGYSCQCGKFSNTLGYYINGSFSDILLDIIGVNIDVSISWD